MVLHVVKVNNMERSTLIDMSKCPRQKRVKVFDYEDKLIATTTHDTTFLYICNEIRKNQIEGCYVVLNGEKYPIRKTGTLFHPEGLFTDYSNLLREFYLQ